MKTQIYLPLFICLFLVVASCKKEPVADPEPDEVETDNYRVVPMDTEMVEYFASPKAGTRFIYVEETTGEIDTLTVIKNERSFLRMRGFPGTPPDSLAWERITVRYHSQKTKDFDVFIFIFFRDENKYGFEIRHLPGVSHRFDKMEGEFVSYETRYGINPVQLMEMDVLGDVYEDVVRVTGESIYIHLWFARNVGIIKKESKYPPGARKTWLLQEIIHP